MLKIDTTRLTGHQLRDLTPLLPADATCSAIHTLDLNPAECPSREALIAWLAAVAPFYWYNGTIVPGVIRRFVRTITVRRRPHSALPSGVLALGASRHLVGRRRVRIS